MRMNILVIPTNDWTRAPGAGHINEIAEELAQRGHSVYAWNFSLYKQQPIKRQPRKVKLISSITLPYRDPAVFFTLNALFQAPAIFRLIRSCKIDVVINENILFGLVAFLSVPKWVLKIFDFSDYFPESASVYYTNSSRTIKKLVEGITLAITKLNVKSSNLCLAVCHSLIRITATIDKRKKCFLLTNGVDTSKFVASKKPDSTNNGPCMVIMGVIDAWLDFQTPLQALKMLKSKYPELKLIIIGPWQRKEFRQKFEDDLRSFQLESNVEITGYVPTQTLTEYLEQATCFVMPYNLDRFYSIIRLPEKLFVYSAYGKAILSTPLPEVAALQPQHVFFYHNPDDFALGLTKILSEQRTRLEIKHKAQAFANDHDFKVLARQLESILIDELAKIRAS